VNLFYALREECVVNGERCENFTVFSKCKDSLSFSIYLKRSYIHEECMMLNFGTDLG